VSPWFGREAQERLARLEQRAADHGRALADQQAALTTALATLAERLSRVEGQLSSIGARFDARVDDVRASISAAGAKQDDSLHQVGQSLKRVRGMEKGIQQDLKKVIGRLAHVGSAFDLSVDERFLAAAQPLVSSRRTMLGYERLFTLWQAASNVAGLNLAAVEVGTFRGGSAALLAQAMRTFAGVDCELHVVDTFEGHLDSTFSEHDPEEQRGKFRGVSYENVREYLAAFPRLTVHRGDASSVVRAWPERRYGLVHLDVDLYQPTLDCLEYFGPRLVEGGVIVMDDYGAPTCPGVRHATQEYLARAPVFQTWKLVAEQAVLIKLRE
jgi:predicted O-methyltransferase YrrM